RILGEPEIAMAFDVEKFPPRVGLNEVNADSLNIGIFYWHFPPAYWDFFAHCQKVNLRLIEEFEKAGIVLALPARSLRLTNDDQRELAVRMLNGDTDGQAIMAAAPVR